MLYLKEANLEDYEEEYKVISGLPYEENGLVNDYWNVTLEEFKNEVIPLLIDHSKGERLKEGYVPDTYYFLWDDEKAVGLFKIRHFLNDFLKNGPGHIGYSILQEYRGKGYATKGLALALKKCREIIPEDEIYLSVHKDNLASLKVQINNGAIVTSETEDEYLTRIKK